ncbi:MAG: sigma-70 family RNA polymerase sigma factor [Acidobacteriota bacterium]
MEDRYYEELRASLTRGVRARYPSLCPQDVEDVVHEALLATMKVLERKGSEVRNPSAYAYKTACHRAAELLRRRSREFPPTDEADFDNSPIDQGNPEVEARWRASKGLIYDCLRSMDNQDRRRAVWLFLMEYRAKEVARIHGWDRRRAENLIYRGRNDLKRCLERKGVGR